VISTSIKKYDPTYNATFRVYRTKGKDITELVKVKSSKSFANWFDVEGTFVKKPFQTWLADNVKKAEKLLVQGKKKK
jgi:hypothetical protein